MNNKYQQMLYFKNSSRMIIRDIAKNHLLCHSELVSESFVGFIAFKYRSETGSGLKIQVDILSFSKSCSSRSIITQDAMLLLFLFPDFPLHG